ncbi:phospholipase D-like domain-containing protein, partial [Staphylococcus aureus]
QGSNYTIMHNKFVIIDANTTNPNNAILWTGSTNWTSQQLSTDANNVIIFQDQSIARGYKAEFDEMWGDTSVTSSANTSLSKFGQFKK